MKNSIDSTRINSIREYQKMLKSMYGEFSPNTTSKFKSVSSNIVHVCKICEYEFNESPVNMLKMRYYPFCKDCVKTQDVSIYNRPLPDIKKYLSNMSLVLLDGYVNDYTDVNLMCLVCDQTFSSSIHVISNSRVLPCKRNHVNTSEKSIEQEHNVDTAENYLSSIGIRKGRIIKKDLERIPYFNTKTNTSLYYTPCVKVGKFFYDVIKIDKSENIDDVLQRFKDIRLGIIQNKNNLRILVLTSDNSAVIELDKDWHTRESHTFKEYVFSERSFSILGLDPGTVNMGYSILEFKYTNNKLRMRVKECGLIQNPVNGLINVKNSVESFISEFESFINSCNTSYPIKGVIAERFMTRGIKGVQIEAVAVMLGAITKYMCDNLPNVDLKFTPAVTWKNKVNLSFDLKAAYKNTKVEPHEVDASLMAVYYAGVLTKTPEVFKQFKLDKFLSEIDCNTTSVIKQYRNRKRKVPTYKQLLKR